MSPTGHTPKPVATFDALCLAASFGGSAALPRLLAALPADLPATVLVVQHRTACDPDPLVTLLAARSSLPVSLARDGDPCVAGTVLVASAASAVTVLPDRTVQVSPADRTLALRPADVMFRSAAAVFGERLIAAVLTGRLDDAAEGVAHVKGAGGRVLVQDPSECAAPSMPRAALATGCVDYALPLAALADAVATLVMAPGAADMMRVGLPAWSRPLHRSAAPTGTP